VTKKHLAVVAVAAVVLGLILAGCIIEVPPNPAPRGEWENAGGFITNDAIGDEFTGYGGPLRAHVFMVNGLITDVVLLTPHSETTEGPTNYAARGEEFVRRNAVLWNRIDGDLIGLPLSGATATADALIRSARTALAEIVRPNDIDS